ncbi:PREDICTED: trafficking protein particle complex subunit 6B-like [Amphimedon queenslandica]|uniref:Trafficking protein particle complex subunit n=1 Tax=Amphimedon queenslandica TaxID=400682 RepID=A0A1X7V411_AMPQE|nr:PREDICTED: trafficking protein particle complex subunit 6B-like [Amphimedon queenslandica]|eukprot:XP_011403378.1 PREDICTED: trafficking protein particle complex subunit 6B-like [Amphimedon queenslandica]
MATDQKAEVKGEVGQALFEFLHMEMVSYLVSSKEKEDQGELISKLEALGYGVGARMMERSCRDVPRFRTELDAMVFLCKQFWVHLFNKQIDHLKTNNQDVFVLYDNNFRLLTHLTDSSQYSDELSRYVAFTSGILTGALSNLGIRSHISYEITKPPQCVFQVKVLL